MFGFGSTTKKELLSVIEEVRQAAQKLGQFEGLKDSLVDRVDHLAQIDELTKKKTELEASLAKLKEDHARETREIEHKIGLHKKQVEHEVKVAAEEARLGVREEALKEQEKRFEEHMAFQRDRFQQEIDAYRKLTEQVLDRLPTWSHQHSTVEHIGAPQPAAIEAAK